jgi:hypothetical protein
VIASTATDCGSRLGPDLESDLLVEGFAGGEQAAGDGFADGAAVSSGRSGLVGTERDAAFDGEVGEAVDLGDDIAG